MKIKCSIVWILMFMLFGNYACASMESEKPLKMGVQQSETMMKKYADIEKKWGIKPLVIRMTGADHFLDFRFMITDAEKAQPVISRQNKAFLKDLKTGKVYPVPVTKIGPMRATAVKPKEDKQYFILFANSDKMIQKGNRVSVVIDKFMVEDLIVE